MEPYTDEATAVRNLFRDLARSDFDASHKTLQRLMPTASQEHRKRFFLAMRQLLAESPLELVYDILQGQRGDEIVGYLRRIGFDLFEPEDWSGSTGAVCPAIKARDHVYASTPDVRVGQYDSLLQADRIGLTPRYWYLLWSEKKVTSTDVLLTWHLRLAPFTGFTLERTDESLASTSIDDDSDLLLENYVIRATRPEWMTDPLSDHIACTCYRRGGEARHDVVSLWITRDGEIGPA